MEDEETASLQRLFLSRRCQEEKRGLTVRYNLIRLLCVLFLERLAFYTILYNLSNFTSNVLNVPSNWITAISDIFTGTAYFFPVLFGALSDRKLGYYPSLVAALTIASIATGGICCLAYYAAQSESHEFKTKFFYAYAASLAVFALCAAAITANLIPYMLEQMGEEDKNRRKLVSYFWSIAYATINVGGTPAMFLNLFNSSPYNMPVIWTYLVPPVTLFIALLTLVVWRREYRSHCVEPRADYWPNFCSILATGFGCYREKYTPPYYDATDLPLKNAKEVEQDRRDEHRKRLGVLVPVLASLLVYYTVYSQVTSSFADQAKSANVYGSNQTENGTYGSNVTFNCTNQSSQNYSYTFPTAMLNIVDVVGVLIAILLIWFTVRPLYERIFLKEISILTKIRWGMIIAFLAIVCALAIEVIVHRQNDVYYAYTCRPLSNNFTNYSIEAIPFSASLSVMSLIPQYVLVGFSEACTQIGVIEFVLSRAPREYRCTAYGLNWAVSGLAFYLSAILIYVFKEYHLYFRQSSSVKNGVVKVHRPLSWIYYLSIAVMMLISIFVFSCIKIRHKDVLRKYREQIRKTEQS